MTQYIPHEEALKVFSRQIALRYQTIPLRLVDRSLHVLCAQPPTANDLSDLIFYSGLAIEFVLEAPETVGHLIENYYPERSITAESTNEPAQYEHRNIAAQTDLGQGQIVDRVNQLISRAALMEASDIHLEPSDSALGIRFRIDGVLQELPSVSKDEQAAVISRIKLMAGMDIAEKRRPQDGRITMQSLDDLLDIRVSSIPTNNNEKLVMRLLNKSDKLKGLSQLGMSELGLELLRKYLTKPQGMILVTGPTGSGKSTTLYAALSHLARPGVNIMTIEDPIEYEIAGITQSQVKPDISYDFSTALRAFLRQDPDIIMVGEIRDQETAQIALRAAMTGHLVLSTLHTNDAVSTIARLIDIGVEPYLVASSVSLVIAQRLMRTYCSSCNAGTPDPTASLKSSTEITRETAPRTKHIGCSECNSTGYRGRIGVFEFLEITDEIRAAIQDHSPARMIESIARNNGSFSLSDMAMQLVAAKRTSREEYHRVLS